MHLLELVFDALILAVFYLLLRRGARHAREALIAAAIVFALRVVVMLSREAL